MMDTFASPLRAGCLVAGSGLVVAFAVTAVRRRRAGAGFGELADLMERDWFSAGKVFFAVLTGLAGSWAAALVGGTRSGLTESVAILFPLGIVAAFAACRFADGAGGRSLGEKAVVLVAAPVALGAIMTGW
ncbi:hypothetical protein ACWC4E_00150 [Streptomyces sp. NPDC001273]|uniref:hypothetical protein n=1 Tax=unclassified Streptomyces TaxID=2593676 RepID=UPI003409F150